jgi:hypothetical protein
LLIPVALDGDPFVDRDDLPLLRSELLLGNPQLLERDLQLVDRLVEVGIGRTR